MSLKQNYARQVNEDLRLTILLLLHEAAGYDLNEHILTASLVEFGHRPSKAKLITELTWLDEQGLCSLQTEPVTVAKLTDRGADVATGRATVPGVKRPSP